MEQLDIARNKYVRFVQESEMLKFQTNDTTGMNYFDSIKRVIREGKIEVNSAKRRFRQNLKTLKALEAGRPKGSLCDFEDSDEELTRIAAEVTENRMEEFVPSIEFASKALTRDEASYFLQDYRVPNDDLA